MNTFFDNLTKPFQVTRMLEWLFALNWIWYFVSFTFLYRYVTSELYTQLQQYYPHPMLSLFFFTVACISVVGLWKNIHLLRSAALLFNIAILIIVIVASALNTRVPFNAGLGFPGILMVLAVISFVRVKYT